MEVTIKKHYNYIDRLKGLAIFMVVLGHLILWSYKTSDGSVFQFVNSVHMPLFFFLSGLVIRKSPSLSRMITMAVRLLSPFIIVGGVFSLFNSDIVGLIVKPLRNGYWYLEILALFYLFLFIRNGIKVKCIKEWIIDIIFILALYTVFTLCYFKYPGQYNDILGFTQARLYWPFFAIGHLVTKYQLYKYINNTGYTIGLILLMLSSYYFLHGYIHLANIVALSFIYVLVYLFMGREECDSYIERCLALAGRKSLDIYIYHYFFISFFVATNIGAYMNQSNYLFYLGYLVIVNIIVTTAAIITGIIVQKSSFLNNLVYGKWIISKK